MAKRIIQKREDTGKRKSERVVPTQHRDVWEVRDTRTGRFLEAKSQGGTLRSSSSTRRAY